MLNHTRGEYITFLDSDDVLHLQHIDQKLAYIQQHPEISAVFSNMSHESFKSSQIAKGNIISHENICNPTWNCEFSGVKLIEFLTPLNVISQYQY